MVLMVFKKNAFKEIVLPNLDNTDFSVAIEKNLFDIQTGFHLRMEVMAHRWRICTEEGVYRLLHHKEACDCVELSGNEVITVETNAGEIFKILTRSGEMSLMPFEKYDLLRANTVTVGQAEDNDICYSFFNLVSQHHCRLCRQQKRFVLICTGRNGVFVNHRRVEGEHVLSFGDVIEIFGLRMVYLGELLAVGSRIAPVRVSDAVVPYMLNDAPEHLVEEKHVVQYFNRAPRFFPEISREKIVIEPPTDPRFSRKKSLFMTIGPSFTMAIPMMLGCGLMIAASFIGGNSTGIFMFTGMITAMGSAVFGAIWALMNIRNTKQTEIADETRRFNYYGNYLVDIASYIQEKYRSNAEALYRLYPSPSECCRYNRVSPELWNRNPSHSDFLFYRLGTGDIDFQIEIDIPQEKFSMQFDSLKDKPAMIYQNFKTLRNVPIGLNFADSTLYGIAGGKNREGVYGIVDNIIAQIAATACYTDVKIVFCFDANNDWKDHWSYIRWLPHVWSENKKTRYYASCKQEAADVFFEIANILRQRAENASRPGEKKILHPYYLLFIADMSLLDGEILGKYIYDTNQNYGMTTFLLTDYIQNLPNNCENIIRNDNQFHGVYHAYGKQNRSSEICFDTVNPAELLRFAKLLSNTVVKETEADTGIASSLDFFEMYSARTFEDFHVTEQWKKNRTYYTMRALIGKKAGGADCFLDIHEKFHGPHGLVAGTTGSGKSELVQTYILSLALNFSPDDIAFFIIDFKGGGMANLFAELPHMAGRISNLSGNQISRAMISIKSENLRRQRIFSEYGVNNINNYTRLYKSGESPFPIPHLLIVIDEFAELKKEEPDFMRELISVAQVGRSLGVHLILATQKPSGTVDDNIWSNAKFRLCLRVQDRQDSMDMLHKPDAAYITQAGRCYMQVGNDEIYELFQSGWSGAVYDASPAGNSGAIATMITATGKEALIGSHTKIKRRERERFVRLCFLYRETVTLLKKQVSRDAIPEQLIVIARQNNYDFGKAQSDMQAFKNFVSLVFSEDEPEETAVSRIIATASASGIKLPEPKNKTQLEALVEYIAKTAEKEHYVHKAQLWMPLLKKEIPFADVSDSSELFDGVKWKSHNGQSLVASVGLYDDPQNQEQLPLQINFFEDDHLAVCGSVVSGKSTFMQTLVWSLALTYSPSELNFYLLDFSGGLLSCFEKLPHSGGIIRENDADKTNKFFTMIEKVLEERKKLFNGGNYSQYIKAHRAQVPAVIIVIDNYAGFREKTNNKYDDVMIYLAREGASYGLFIALTAAGFGLSEIPNRVGDNIKTVISLEMSDKFKYMDVMRTTHLEVVPESGIKGRGLANVDGRLLEFQTAVAYSTEDDYQRNAMIEKMCLQMREHSTGIYVRSIPCIPENPRFIDLKQNSGYAVACANHRLLPFAYRFSDASVYSVSLPATYCYIISGKKRTGKTNVLKLMMMAAAEKDCKAAVIEKNSMELKAFSARFGFEYIEDDKSILQYFQGITSDFVQRNKRKKVLEEQGLSDSDIFEQMQAFPQIYIFIADLRSFIQTVYHPEGDIGNLNGFFENIFEKGFLHNIFFFACFNTDEASELTGLKAYHSFLAYKTGVHLGGNLSSQRIFSFQNIPYTQLSKASKKEEGLVPSGDDEAVAEKIILPLVGGSGS